MHKFFAWYQERLWDRAILDAVNKVPHLRSQTSHLASTLSFVAIDRQPSVSQGVITSAWLIFVQAAICIRVRVP